MLFKTSTNTFNVRFTHHAGVRAAQRGATHAAMGLILDHGDIEQSMPRGRRSLRLSQRRAAELVSDQCPISVVEQAQRIELIVGDDDCVVTVLRCDPTARRKSWI